MAKADHDLLARDTRANVGFRFVRIPVALLDLVRDLVGAAVLGAAQGADAAGDRAIHVGAGAGDDAAGEGAGVELVLGVQDERGVHRPYPGGLRLLAVKQMEVMATDRVIVRYGFDPPAARRVVIPVQEHRAEARHQSIGDVACALGGMLLVLGLDRAEH